MALNQKQQTLCENSSWRFSDLRALFLDCMLMRLPERSHPFMPPFFILCGTGKHVRDAYKAL